MFDFIIIGAQKSGTTSAAYNLNLHPEISMFSGVTNFNQYEIEFYNQHWEMGADWYFSHVPPGPGLKGEKTAELLHRLTCHKRIFETNPKVKLIVFLRNPVDRAFSQWKMARYIKKDENRSFPEIVESEINMLKNPEFKNNFYNCHEANVSCWREGYLIKGLYKEQLKNLFTYFSRNQVHIAVSETVRKNKIIQYNKIFNFLGVSDFKAPFEDKFISPSQATMDAFVHEKLIDFYRSYNLELFDFLGFNIDEWTY